MLTASGWARCSSPQPQASVRCSSGVSLPSGVGTANSLRPADLLGRPALVGVDVRGRRSRRRRPSAAAARVSATTFAPVPLKTGNTSACSPNCSRTTSLQARGVDVLAVGDLVAAVGGGDGGEHLGVHAGVVVAREAAVVRCRGVGSRAHSLRCADVRPRIRPRRAISQPAAPPRASPARPCAAARSRRCARRATMTATRRGDRIASESSGSHHCGLPEEEPQRHPDRCRERHVRHDRRARARCR